MEYLTFLKLAHLTGLIIGFGGALYADFLMVTGGVFKPLKEKTLKEVERVSYFVAYGLLLLWVSGIALGVELMTTTPQFILNEKFWAKVVIVVVLTLNGFFVHHVVLREAKKSLNKRLLIDSSLPITVLLTISGAVSFVSWVTPFVLGKAAEFSYVVPFEIITTLWVITVLVAIAGLLSLIALHAIWTTVQNSRKSIVPRLGGLAF